MRLAVRKQTRIYDVYALFNFFLSFFFKLFFIAFFKKRVSLLNLLFMCVIDIRTAMENNTTLSEFSNSKS